MFQDKTRYAIIIPVWGDHHTKLLVDYCLPFLFTDGNLGAFKQEEMTVFIVSKDNDFRRMRMCETYKKLLASFSVRELIIPSHIDFANPHTAMTACYVHALSHIDDAENTVTFFPTPDCILSRNALKFMRSKIDVGYKAVMICGLRLDLESSEKTLIERNKSGNITSYSEAEMVGELIKNLHSISKSCDVNGEITMKQWPSHLYWPILQDQFLIARCFHLHPMAVHGIPPHINPKTTIDDDYIEAAGIKERDIYICCNSDDMVCFELSPSHKTLAASPGPISLEDVRQFLNVGVSNQHKEYFNSEIIFHSGKRTKPPKGVRSQINAYSEVVNGKPKIYRKLRDWGFGFAKSFFPRHRGAERR